MATPEIEFSHLRILEAEAFGQPGQRTFCIRASSEEGSAIVWLEKNQLYQLANAIVQLLSTIVNFNETIKPTHPPDNDNPAPQLNFQVGKIVLASDDSKQQLIMDLHDVDYSEISQPTLRIRGSYHRFKPFSEKALEVCAAGRPTCPLCGELKDSPHLCPRTNGHGVENLDSV